MPKFIAKIYELRSGDYVYFTIDGVYGVEKLVEVNTTDRPITLADLIGIYLYDKDLQFLARLESPPTQKIEARYKLKKIPKPEEEIPKAKEEIPKEKIKIEGV